MAARGLHMLPQILFMTLAGVAVLRLLTILREQPFAQALLVAGAGWTKLEGAYLFDIRQGVLWKFYLWSLRWRRLPDPALKVRCVRWLVFDVVTVSTSIGLLLVLWDLGTF